MPLTTFRRTKIICTIGPATHSYQLLEKLHSAGMNVVRLNMSHAGHENAAQVIRWIRTLNRKVRYPVAVMLDTQGPEIRTGDLEKPIELASGEIVELTVLDETDVEHTSIRVHYNELITSVAVGDRITVDNGLMNFKVLEKQGGKLRCLVLDGGTLGSKRHVNLPGIRVNLPSITDKDVKDIQFGIEQGVDFIALSFVRAASDVHDLRKLLGKKAQAISVIAKIEDQEGVTHMDEIAEAADGLMVARGDLGIETNISELPNIQRQLVKMCAIKGKRCIVATHLLESMISNPIPTRAEVTDVANAIYEGVDGIMLSGETGIGKYPVRCVEQLQEIAHASEKIQGLGFETQLLAKGDKQFIAQSAVDLAHATKAAGIVVITRRGITADQVTNCNPIGVPVFAFSNISHTRRRLMLNRSVYSFRTAFSREPEKTLQTAFKVLIERAQLSQGDKVVVISDVLADTPVESIQLRTL